MEPTAGARMKVVYLHSSVAKHAFLAVPYSNTPRILKIRIKYVKISFFFQIRRVWSNRISLFVNPLSDISSVMPRHIWIKNGRGTQECLQSNFHRSNVSIWILELRFFFVVFSPCLGQFIGVLSGLSFSAVLDKYWKGVLRKVYRVIFIGQRLKIIVKNRYAFPYFLHVGNSLSMYYHCLVFRRTAQNA